MRHLTIEEMQRAAQVAAGKYFSTDQAMDRDDFESIAMVRILNRNPTTIATAVHVGREGIMREVKYARYAKATETIQFSVFESDSSTEIGAEKPVRRRETQAEIKLGRFVKKIARKMGPPVETFGKHGVAYHEGSVPDSVLRLAGSCDRPFMVRTRAVDDAIRTLAEREPVLAVIVSGELQAELW